MCKYVLFIRVLIYFFIKFDINSFNLILKSFFGKDKVCMNKIVKVLSRKVFFV